MDNGFDALTRTLAVALALLLCAGIAGCGEGSGQTATSPAADVGKVVLSLEQGISVDDAKAELGKPDFEFGDEEETSLRYDRWRLLFLDDRLRERRREVIIARGSSGEFDSRAFDRKVLRLHPGTPIETVRSRLGEEEAHDEVFEGGPVP